MQPDPEDNDFRALLQEVEVEGLHLREVGITVPNGSSSFLAVLQRLAEKHWQQVKDLRIIVANCKTEVEILEKENAKLRKANPDVPSVAVDQGRHLLPELRRQLIEGAELHSIVDILSRIGLTPEIDDAVAHEDSDGRGLIHLCLAHPSIEPLDLAALVQLLARKSCDLERKNRLGETPLCFALRQEASEAAKILLSCEACPNVFSHHHGETPVMIAVRSSRLDSVQMLLEKRADPSVGDACGETPLMEAASQGSVEMCELLLNHGADVTARNQFELRASDFAEDALVIELLLAAELPSVSPEEAPLPESQSRLALAQEAVAAKTSAAQPQVANPTLKSQSSAKPISGFSDSEHTEAVADKTSAAQQQVASPSAEPVSGLSDSGHAEAEPREQARAILYHWRAASDNSLRKKCLKSPIWHVPDIACTVQIIFLPKGMKGMTGSRRPVFTVELRDNGRASNEPLRVRVLDGDGHVVSWSDWSLVDSAPPWFEFAPSLDAGGPTFQLACDGQIHCVDNCALELQCLDISFV